MKRKANSLFLITTLLSVSFLSSCSNEPEIEQTESEKKQDTEREKFSVTFKLNNLKNEEIKKEYYAGDTIDYPSNPVSSNSFVTFSHWAPYYEKMPEMNLVISAKYDDIVTLGSYPQSIVHKTETSLLNKLNEGIEVPTFNSEENVWNKNGFTAFDWYDAGVKSEYAFYIEKDVEGLKYRGIYLTKYRHHSSGSAALTAANTTNSRMSAANRTTLNELKWFRYEPIKWIVLDNKEGRTTLICSTLLDTVEYQPSTELRKLDGDNQIHYASEEGYDEIEGTTIYPNNWNYSNVRKWLNGSFMDVAFTAAEKSKIQLSRVKNDYSTTRQDTTEEAYTPFLSTESDDYVYVPSLADFPLYNDYGVFGLGYGILYGNATHYLFSTGNVAVGINKEKNTYKPNYIFRGAYSTAAAGTAIGGLNNAGSISSLSVLDTTYGVRPIIQVKL